MRLIRFLITLVLLLFISNLAPRMVKAQSFAWPTSGWIGYIYKSPTTYCTGNCHTGIDIWSNKNGGWNGGVVGSSNPIYPVASGTLIWEGSSGYIIQHSPSLFTLYFHVKDRQVHPTTSVNTSTLLGNQDTSGGAVHLHLTISATSNDSGNIDPSGYLGLKLNYNDPSHIGFLTNTVLSGSGCGGNSVLKSNWKPLGPLVCSASSMISVYPESILNGNSGTINLRIN